MRRLFIMRKDLNMSPGKLAAQISHCAEAYWTRVLRANAKLLEDGSYEFKGIISKEIFDEYINGTFTKIVCQARNKNHLLEARALANEIGLIEGVHYGLIYDKCLTELYPEEADGTTLTGIWFCPLSDSISHLYT